MHQHHDRNTILLADYEFISAGIVQKNAGQCREAFQEQEELFSVQTVDRFGKNLLCPGFFCGRYGGGIG